MSNINFSLYQKLIPSVFRQQDPHGALRAVVDGAQEQYDLTAGEILGILNFVDLDTCPPEFLPYLAANIGLRLYQEDPVDLQRYQIRRWVELLKFKGTVRGFEILARLLGYEGRVIQLYEDSPDGNKFEHPAAGLHMSSDVRLVMDEIVDGQIRRLAGNENGALTPEFIQRLLGRIESVRPIHINVLGINIGKILNDKFNVVDEITQIGIGTPDIVDWISCHWHGRATKYTGKFIGPWDMDGYAWDEYIHDNPDEGHRFYWDTMNIPDIAGPFIRHNNAKTAYRNGQYILDRDNQDEWDETGASWDEAGESWDTNSSPFVHGPYDVTARHNACGYDSDPLAITARGIFTDDMRHQCVHHDGRVLRDRTGRIIYDRRGIGQQCDPAFVYIRNVNCPEMSFWDCEDEVWHDTHEYFWDQPFVGENDPYLVQWDTPHGHEVLWDKPPRREPDPDDHWDAVAVPYRKWDVQGLEWDELSWDDAWVFWDDPEENEHWDGFEVTFDEFQSVYDWDNPNPYSYWDDGDLHWDLPGLLYDEGMVAWDDENFHWDGYCGNYYLWDDPEQDYAWDVYTTIWDDQDPVACGYIPN